MLARALTWAAIFSALGARSFALLAAANLCASAARGAAALSTRRSVLLRRAADAETLRMALRRAWLAEGASMLACLTLLAAIASYYDILGRPEIIPLLVLLGCGLPARCNGPLKARQRGVQLSAVLRSWLGLALVLGVILVHAELAAVTAALAAREWLTSILLTLIPVQPPSDKLRAKTIDRPPDMHEFIAATSAQATVRFMYHAVRSTLHVVAGPFGTGIARTLRHYKAYRRGSGHPALRVALPLVIVGGLGGSVLLLELPGPGSLLTSALLLRMGLLAASSTLWSRMREDTPVADDADMLEDD